MRLLYLSKSQARLNCATGGYIGQIEQARQVSLDKGKSIPLAHNPEHQKWGCRLTCASVVLYFEYQ